MSDEVPQMKVTELKRKLDEGEDVVVLDVREPHELRICSLQNTLHIPLADLADRLDELEKFKDREIVVYCRSGRRSDMAAGFMLQSGFNRVYNLEGGILAWSDEIDSTFQKY